MVAAESLIRLLGESRAQVFDALRGGDHTVAELAGELGVSQVAIRRHLQILELDGLVSAETVRRDGPGRPSARYSLTSEAYGLLPDRSAEFANDLLHYVEAEHGRAAVLGFLRARQDAQGARYAGVLERADGMRQQVDSLARLLSEDGFDAQAETVTAADGTTVLRLTQGHCAIKAVAEEHPEVCAYEAALFRRLLGTKVSRRETIAAGSHECVCVIPTEPEPRSGAHHGDQS